MFDPTFTEAVSSFLLMALFVVVILLVVAGIIAGALYGFILWSKNRKRESDALNSTLLQVAVPRENEIKIDAAEQFFASLSSIRKGGMFSFMKPQPHISLEIVGLPGDIRFYVHTPNKLKDLVEKQINGAYPDAEITVLDEKHSKQKENYVVGDEYNIFSKDGKVAFTGLQLKTSDYMPIKVFKDLPTDPLSSITSVLAKMTEGEGAAIQIIITPADSKWKKFGKAYLSKTKKNEANPEKATYSADAKSLEGIENKLHKPAFETYIRIVVSSSTEESAEAHLSNITSAFNQFAGSNSFSKKKPRFKGMFMEEFIHRYMPLRGQGSILSSEELATLFHFPNKSITTPNIYWLSAKRAPAPATIPTSGLYLGRSTFRGISKPVYMDMDDRRRHMYIIGKTGTGKSEFLKDMIMQDIRGGQGLGADG